MVLKKILLSQLDFKKTKPFCPPDVKCWLIDKDPDAGKGWRQKGKRVAEDEIDSITDLVDMNLSKLQEIVKDKGAWRAAVHRVSESDMA